MKKTQWSYIKDFILEKYVSTKEGITIITKEELLISLTDKHTKRETDPTYKKGHENT